MRFDINKPTENIRSDALASLRHILEGFSGLNNYVGAVFQVRLIIDTNAVISDLLWMAKRKQEDNKTAFIEVINAGTLIAYAPEQLKEEINKHLPAIAEKKKIPYGKIHSEWIAYQSHLKFVEVDDEKLTKYEASIDPKDAPFVVLAEMLNAEGVISNDPHIEQIGGKRINLDIRLSLRDYSRSAAIAFSLRFGGVLVSYVSIGAIALLGKTLSKLFRVISNLPDRIKILLVVGVILVFIFPKTREKLFNFLQSTGELLGEAWKEISPTLGQLFNEATQENEEAKRNLAIIQSHLS